MNMRRSLATRATVAIESDERHFNVRAWQEIGENREPVAEHEWSKTIARDFQ